VESRQPPGPFGMEKKERKNTYRLLRYRKKELVYLFARCSKGYRAGWGRVRSRHNFDTVGDRGRRFSSMWRT
jgi:hypothetical protein